MSRPPTAQQRHVRDGSSAALWGLAGQAWSAGGQSLCTKLCLTGPLRCDASRQCIDARRVRGSARGGARPSAGAPAAW